MSTTARTSSAAKSPSSSHWNDVANGAAAAGPGGGGLTVSDATLDVGVAFVASPTIEGIEYVPEPSSRSTRGDARFPGPELGRGVVDSESD